MYDRVLLNTLVFNLWSLADALDVQAGGFIVGADMVADLRVL